MPGQRIAGLTTLAAIALIVACGGRTSGHPTQTAQPTPPPAIEIARGQPIRIGVSAAMSGDQRSLGADLADAVELAVRDRGATLKGHTVIVARMDDGCGDAEKAVGVARSLVGDASIAGVVGPMCTTGAQAADSVYEAAHVVHILPSATRADLSEQGERFFFRTAWLDDAQAQTQARYAREQVRAASAILVDDNEPYGKTLADGFAAAFSGGGGAVASRERIKRGDRDFTTLARRVKAASPDIVVFEGLNPEAALVVKALRAADYRGAFMAPDGVLSTRDFIDAADSAADGAIVTGGPAPDDAYVAQFRDAFQRMPGTPFVLQARDAATLLLTAIESVATERADGTLVIDREQLADAIRTRGLDGLTGTVRFDDRGDRGGETAAEAGLAVYRVVSGRFEALP